MRKTIFRPKIAVRAYLNWLEKPNPEVAAIGGLGRNFTSADEIGIF